RARNGAAGGSGRAAARRSSGTPGARPRQDRDVRPARRVPGAAARARRTGDRLVVGRARVGAGVVGRRTVLVCGRAVSCADGTVGAAGSAGGYSAMTREHPNRSTGVLPPLHPVFLSAL